MYDFFIFISGMKKIVTSFSKTYCLEEICLKYYYGYIGTLCKVITYGLDRDD